MGPEGGVKGGNIIAEGKPEEICKRLKRVIQVIF